VRGANTHLYFKKPVVLKNLIVLEGAKVSDAAETKLDVTVTDHLYVDGDSGVDVSAKGYLGGWQQSDDHLFTNDQAGRTIASGTGANGGASASYGGIAGDGGGTPNATYGSIANPADFGSGGSGGANSGAPGGHGGGAAILHGGSVPADLGRIVVAGSIRADGEGVCCSGRG